MKSYYFRCDRVDASFTRKCSIEASDSISVLFSFPLHSHCHVILIYICSNAKLRRTFAMLVTDMANMFPIKMSAGKQKSSFFTICSSLHSESKSYKTVQYLECKSMKEWLYHNVNLRGKNHLVNNFPCFYALLKNDLAFGVYGPVFFFFSWDFLALQGIALTATSDNKACSNVNKESSCLLSLSVGFSAGSWVGILTGANKILCRIYQFQFQRNTITYLW